MIKFGHNRSSATSCFDKLSMRPLKPTHLILSLSKDDFGKAA
jgi:hypothetical protein